MSFNTHAGLWEKLYYKLFLSTQVYHGRNAMVEGDGGGGGGGGARSKGAGNQGYNWGWGWIWYEELQSNLHERPPPVGDHPSWATTSQSTVLSLSQITIFVTSCRSPPLVEDCDHFLRVWTGNFSVILPLFSDHLGDHAICWTKDSKHGFIFSI